MFSDPPGEELTKIAWKKGDFYPKIYVYLCAHACVLWPGEKNEDRGELHHFEKLPLPYKIFSHLNAASSNSPPVSQRPLVEQGV